MKPCEDALAQENERLYPRFRAPKGRFCVRGLDTARARGEIIATCGSLEIAVAVADKVAASGSEITVENESGKELYRASTKSLDKSAAN